MDSKRLRLRSTAFVVLSAMLLAMAGAGRAGEDSDDRPTRTPIKRLVVVIGENVSFDTLFATYLPASGQSVLNLLSQEIVNAEGNPGRNYARAVQHEGSNRGGLYTVPPLSLAPYAALPQPTLAGVFDPRTLRPFGLIPDPRFAGLSVNGPFQITRYVDYNGLFAATEDPVHRFFQMWQQTGGTNATLEHFAWVAINAGTGGDTPGVTPQNPGQGAGLMGFFNMASGDAPFFRQLARDYALSDNFHQAIMGGTGANFFALATGGALPVYNVNGALASPPPNQIENPDALPRTANFYTQDGYAGGSYVNCSDASQPGVAAILDIVGRHGRASNCVPGAYYLVNNYEPPFNLDGSARPLGPNQFIYPPQTIRTIGEALSARGVSWKWYTGGRDAADVFGDSLFALVRAGVEARLPGAPPSVIDAIAYSNTLPLIYNSLGDPLNGSANVVGGALRDNLKGLDTFYRDAAQGSLPAVSFVVPKNLDSGHPGYSTVRHYESFVQDLLARLQSDAERWQETAVLITTDEGGGYFDSGPIEVLDFFGDGPRIPLIAVSRHARRGHVDHVYQDHVSILKFIERNWHLPPLSARSRDRLPNPVMDQEDRYRPRNSPAIGDLMTLFDFSAAEDD